MEHDVQEYAVPYVSPSWMAVRQHLGVTYPRRPAVPPTMYSAATAYSADGAIGLPAAPTLVGVSAVSPPHPSGYCPKIWWDRPLVTRSRPTERSCTATRHPRVHLHKKLSTCYASLYFLLSSAISCLWSPTTSSSPLTAHLLRSCFFLPTSPFTRDAGQ